MGHMCAHVHVAPPYGGPSLLLPLAPQGFNNPKWVDGELLVFGADSAFVQGAQLGFTYDVNRSQRYLVLLHRVDLDDLFPEED